MKKLSTITLVATMGIFTACTSNTTTPEPQTQKSTAIDTVKDTAVNVAKGVAVAAATKKVKEMASKDKK